MLLLLTLFLSEKLVVLRHTCIIYVQDVMNGSLVTRCRRGPTQIDSRMINVLEVSALTVKLAIEDFQLQPKREGDIVSCRTDHYHRENQHKIMVAVWYKVLCISTRCSFL